MPDAGAHRHRASQRTHLGSMSDKKRKADGQPLQDCPITGLPINDKLVKKLKGSTMVTKKTLTNTLQNKLGWPPQKILDSWSKDTLIQEYYAALEMQKAQASAVSPVARSPPASSVRTAPGRSRNSAPISSPTPAQADMRRTSGVSHGTPVPSSRLGDTNMRHRQGTTNQGDTSARASYVYLAHRIQPALRSTPHSSTRTALQLGHVGYTVMSSVGSSVRVIKERIGALVCVSWWR